MVGAIGEMTACADLLKRGFEVFRSVSATCSCDLIILKNKKLLRVEVRTGTTNQITGRISVPKTKLKLEKYDIFATIVNGIIYYAPPLPE